MFGHISTSALAISFHSLATCFATHFATPLTVNTLLYPLSTCSVSWLLALSITLKLSNNMSLFSLSLSTRVLWPVHGNNVGASAESIPILSRKKFVSQPLPTVLQPPYTIAYTM